LALAGYDSFARLAERVAGLAARYAAMPAPALELQSQSEPIIRAAPGAVAAGLRAYEDGRVA
jgi:hypothetical protein